MLLSMGVWGQSYNRFWYFGDKAGLDFGVNYSNTNPIAISSTLPYQFEGIATISTNNGVYAAFTNGINIYNRNHTLQTDALLNGSNDSAQSGIIVPDPKGGCEFFVFSVFDARPLGKPLSWRKFKLNSDASIQTVSPSNQTAFDGNSTTIYQCSEKLYAFKDQNSNNNKYYIISTIKNSKSFMLGEIDNTMNVPTFRKIDLEANIDANNINVASGQFGSLKVSPDGKYMAICGNGEGVRLYKIEYANGTISKINFDKVIQRTDSFGWYGLEFSPNSKNLFYTAAGYAGSIVESNYLQGYAVGSVYVHNIDNNSSKILWNSNGDNRWNLVYKVGAIQKAPGRNELYVANPQQKFLGIITNPNDYSTTVYTHNQIELKEGTLSLAGLPNQIYDNVNFGCDTPNVCQNPTINIIPQSNTGKDPRIINDIINKKIKDINLINKTNISTNPISDCYSKGNYIATIGNIGSSIATYNLVKNNETKQSGEVHSSNPTINLLDLTSGTYTLTVIPKAGKECQSVQTIIICEEAPCQCPEFGVITLSDNTKSKLAKKEEYKCGSTIQMDKNSSQLINFSFNCFKDARFVNQVVLPNGKMIEGKSKYLDPIAMQELTKEYGCGVYKFKIDGYCCDKLCSSCEIKVNVTGCDTPKACDVECCIPSSLKLANTWINGSETSIFYRETSRNVTKIAYEPTQEIVNLIDSYILQMQSNIIAQKCENSVNANFQIAYKLYKYNGSNNFSDGQQIQNEFSTNRNAFSQVATLNNYRTSDLFNFSFNGDFTAVIEIEMKWTGINNTEMCNTIVVGALRNFTSTMRLNPNTTQRQFKKYTLQSNFLSNQKK